MNANNNADARSAPETTTDPVNHPPHYTRGSIEVRDFIADQKLNFNRGSVIKYVTRAGYKDPSKEIEDLKKARSCIDHEIAALECRRHGESFAEIVRGQLEAERLDRVRRFAGAAGPLIDEVE